MRPSSAGTFWKYKAHAGLWSVWAKEDFRNSEAPTFQALLERRPDPTKVQVQVQVWAKVDCQNGEVPTSQALLERRSDPDPKVDSRNGEAPTSQALLGRRPDPTKVEGCSETGEVEKSLE